MGYTTDFSGSFQLSRPATVQEKNYLDKLAKTRRMKRDVEKLHELYKGKGGLPLVEIITPEMMAHAGYFEELGFKVTLERVNDTRTPEQIYGNGGEYFVGAGGHAGQDRDASVIDYNSPPSSQPGLWLQWVLNEDGTQLKWDGNEKFYGYVEWLKYLINHFFEPWGINLNGEVEWTGEDRNDIGKIVVTNNVVEVKEGKIIY